MIGIKELASKIDVHPNTIRAYIKKGLPHIQLKRKFLFDYEEVINWLKKNREVL